MSNTIKNFLVGVGLDTKDFKKGEKEVSGGLSRFRSLAGFAGAAMVGAFATASSAAIATGNRIDSLALSTEGLKTSIGFVYDWGNALRRLGGDAAEAGAAVLTAETALAQFKEAGNFGPLEQTIFAGVDTSALLQAQDGEEFIRMLAEMVPDLSSEQQRILQDTLGFSDAVMRSLRDGSQAFDASIERARSLTGGIEDLTEASRRFNQELTDTKLSIEGASNALSLKMLPALAGILETTNDLIDRATTPRDPDAPTAWENMLDNGVFGKNGGDRREWHRKGFGDVTGSVGGWIGNQRQKAIDRRSDYQEMMSGSVDSQEAIQATPEYNIINNNNGERATMPPQTINNNLDLKVQIDGREIDSRVVDTIERRERATIEDMQSTTVR